MRKSIFWRILEMLLLNCEVTLDLNCVICEEDRPTTFAMINAKLYVPVVTL